MIDCGHESSSKALHQANRCVGPTASDITCLKIRHLSKQVNVMGKSIDSPPIQIAFVLNQ